MSRPQEPHRPFFSFGNPFRMVSPKGSQLSAGLLSLLNAFEETLAERFRKLIPKDRDDALSLEWMKSAMESLCETHNDIKTLITDLELPIADWDEQWIDVYLDISVKLLDICNAFSSELARLNQGHILLQCVLHDLECNTSKKFFRCQSTLDSWRKHIAWKNIRVQNCLSILDGLEGSLSFPKVKNSAKGTVLMRALYGVKVQTVSICSLCVAGFSSSSKNLLVLDVPGTILWAQAYSDLQTSLNMETGETFSHGKFTVLKELDAVDSVVKKLHSMIERELQPAEVEALQHSISDLRKGSERLHRGIDLLAKQVDIFFKIVLSGRDALLSNLRAADAVTQQMLGTNIGEQLVR